MNNDISGCSMVLMPTRVLQVLEKHFSKMQQDSNAPPPHSGGSPKGTYSLTFIFIFIYMDSYFLP